MEIRAIEQLGEQSLRTVDHPLFQRMRSQFRQFVHQ
jgi:hypothetical protein